MTFKKFTKRIPWTLIRRISIDKASITTAIFSRTYGVEKVYSRGLIAEFTGNTNTAIQA